MILMRILPGVLKELSKHVPAVLFQTVEWSELMSEFPRITRRILQKEGYQDLYDIQKSLLDPYDIVLSEHLINNSNLVHSKCSAEKILTLYFVQLFSSKGLFLDLRVTNFNCEGDKLVWHPSSFWTSFSENFREGLLKVYEGFYLENDDLFYEGLTEIGLLKESFSGEEKKKLGDLFKAQFGESMSGEMKFNLEHFKDSIIKMSNFLLSKKVNISKDFLYLGIYLVTLYSTLEEINVPLPVKQIYCDVNGRFRSKELG